MNAVTTARPRTSRSSEEQSSAGVTRPATKPTPEAGERSKQSRAKAKTQTPGTTKPSKRARTHKAAAANEARPTKQGQLAAMLVRDEGATIAQMTAATRWLPHTVRAAITGLRKKGYSIDSDRINGVRTYRAMAPQ